MLKVYRYRLYKPSHYNFGSVAKVRADFFQSDFDYKYYGIKTESNTPEEIFIGYKGVGQILYQFSYFDQRNEKNATKV